MLSLADDTREDVGPRPGTLGLRLPQELTKLKVDPAEQDEGKSQSRTDRILVMSSSKENGFEMQDTVCSTAPS